MTDGLFFLSVVLSFLCGGLLGILGQKAEIPWWVTVILAGLVGWNMSDLVVFLFA